MIYARLNPTDYAAYLRRAMGADVDSMRTTSLEGLQGLDDEAIMHDILEAPLDAVIEE